MSRIASISRGCRRGRRPLAGLVCVVAIFSSAAGAPPAGAHFAVELVGSRLAAAPRALAGAEASPRALAQPTIEGRTTDPLPNERLVVSGGTWAGAEVKYSYQWQRSVDAVVWGDVAGGTTQAYYVQTSDIGAFLRVRVTATDAGGPVSAVSEPTARVTSGSTVDVTGLHEGDGVLPVPPVVAGPVPPVSTVVPNGGGGDASTARVNVEKTWGAAVKYQESIVISGRLVDAGNTPITNAEVDVFEQLMLGGASWLKIGAVRTDHEGHFEFRPKTGASRRIRFAFADRSGSSSYRVTGEAVVLVKAEMSISAKRRVVAPRGRIRLRGRVVVDSLPTAGTWVEIQVRDAGGWRTVATRKTSSTGAWAYNYRLKQSRGASFLFRSRLRVQGDVASTETKSDPVKVRIR